MANLERIEAMAARLPETERVDVEAWDGHPTFRVRGKNFVFTNVEGDRMTVKLDREEAAAVVASEPGAEPAGYGLGRHGWVVLELPPDPDEEHWQRLEEWVRTSYTLVAPKKLAKVVRAEDQVDHA